MTSTTDVNLLELAATSLAAAIVAARKIKNLANDSDDDEDEVDSNDEAVDHKNARLKEDGSCVTDADIAAQGIIVQAIRQISADVRIVGEESDEDMQEAQNLISKEDGFDQHMYELALQEICMRYNRSPAKTLPLAQSTENIERYQADTLPHPGIRLDEEHAKHHAQDEDRSRSMPLHEAAVNNDKRNVEGSSNKESASESDDTSKQQSPYLECDVHVDVSRVCVFIDPLDGTTAYSRGEYDIVSILIAIILDQRPCFGIICKPFGYSGKRSILDTGSVCFYGGTMLGGVYTAGSNERTVPTAPANASSAPLPRAVISSSRANGVVQDFCSYLGEKGFIHPEPLLVGGAGEKSLRIILRTQHEGLWFYPKPGTSLWDVAASDALLQASGGKLTDSFGNDMDYSKTRTQAENEEGVIACYDKNLHSECVRLFRSGSWVETHGT